VVIARARMKRMMQRTLLHTVKNSVRVHDLYPVVIVGAGPVGLYLSCILARYKVRSLLVEGEECINNEILDFEKGISELPPHPRAHVIHTRTMEILRALGLEEKVWGEVESPSTWSSFLYSTGIFENTEVLAKKNHFYTEKYKLLQKSSPTKLAQISQPKLEAILMNESIELQGTDYLFNTRALDCSYDNDTGLISVDLENNKSVQCKHLLVCDGANSYFGNEVLKVPQRGQNNIENFASIHFSSKKLGQYLLKHKKSSMLNFIYSKDIIAVLVSHNVNLGEYILHVPFFPPYQSAMDIAKTKDQCIDLIKESFGEVSSQDENDVIEDIEFHTVKYWGMHVTMREKLSMFNDQIHLIGDAAHQFPPSGGFGVNTAIGDAHNLGWKIAMIENDLTSKKDKVLASYEKERLPVINESVNQAMINYRRGLLTAETLGLYRNQLTMFTNVFENTVGKVLPSDLSKNLFTQSIDFGKNLKLAMFNLSNGRKENLRKMVEDTEEALPLLYPYTDLGYSYNDENNTKMVDIGTFQFRNVSREEAISEKPYVPSTKRGHLLPHTWLKYKNQVISSIDLVGLCKLDSQEDKTVPKFTIFLKSNHFDEESLQDLKEYPVRFIVIHDNESKIPASDDQISEFTYHVLDKGKNSLFPASDKKLIIVRPDGHVLEEIQFPTSATIKSNIIECIYNYI
jgi:2-polyprenyl-6-methoxyphenol hydroxylase-like FAD-dependent oxidoreductase